MCQEFHADQGDSPSQTFKLGAGYEATLIIGSGVGPLQQRGTPPPGMTVDVSGGKIRVTGTPTETGEFTLDLRPDDDVMACEYQGTSLMNFALKFTVVPAECETNLACRLFNRGACTQSSTCVPSPSYVSAACIPTVGSSGVCVDVNGPADQCTGAISAMTLTTVEGAQVDSCVVTPAITGCNHHVCFGPPVAE